jgi:hypothetical protein
MEFKAITSRKLKFVCGTVEQEIIVAISAPYTPAIDKARAEMGFSGCGVLTCDDPTLAYEVYGRDEFEALEMAVVRVREFLSRLSRDPRGSLQHPDGRKFESSGSDYWAGYLKLLLKEYPSSD